jgi:hypothetical protein
MTKRRKSLPVQVDGDALTSDALLTYLAVVVTKTQLVGMAEPLAVRA